MNLSRNNQLAALLTGEAIQWLLPLPTPHSPGAMSLWQGESRMGIWVSTEII
jgi:hypothetical protein